MTARVPAPRAADARPPRRAWATLRRGLALSPEFRDGLALTLVFAVVAVVGRVVVPVAVQLTLDEGLGTGRAGDADAGLVAGYALAGLSAVALTAAAGYQLGYRLARSSERALCGLRVRTFRHIHDLSLLHPTSEHRGALVARVTADIDEISRFLQWGGIILVVNVGQLLVATAVMAIYSWQLTLVVLAVFAPLVAVLRWFQTRLSVAYDVVRARVGDMLTAVSETVAGAAVIRAYAIEERANTRVGDAVERQFRAAYRAHRIASVMFSSGEVFAAVATAAAVVVGVVLGVGGELTAGRLVAFLFLISLFVAPVQIATEVLDQAQTAIAGWRRVLDVLDTPADVADPERTGASVAVPPGPISARFERVSFAYPAGGGSPVLRDVDVEIPARSRVAVVGETGSGKTTFAKLLTRLMDPTRGRVLVNGVPLDRVAFASLRRRVVMVPQDGFLFDGSVADNVRMGTPTTQAGADQRRAFVELGLGEWLDALPDGPHTRVGERGEFLSAGERQLVALARAYVANPDLLVLDEATSAVDPATEARISRALKGLTRGRTVLTIAHRLSTAETADEVLVFDRGRVVERGPHARLVDAGGVYARLHANWTAGASGKGAAGRA